MDSYLKLTDLIITTLLAIIGLYLANNYRRYIRQKISDSRITAYGKLWELTVVAAPMRRKKWHKGDATGIISQEEREDLYKATTDWYFSGGKGMFLGNSTRNMYLTAKHNLICPDEELKPAMLIEVLNGLSKEERRAKRSALITRQLSLLRHRMRVDLAIYGNSYFGDLDEEDKAFLIHCNENWKAKYWQNAVSLST